MEIICDSNVWYGIANGTLNIPASKDLVLTASSYFDWFASPMIDRTHQKHNLLLEAFRAAKRNSSRSLLIDPFDHPAHKLFGYIPKDQTLKSFQLMDELLENMARNNYDNDAIRHISTKCRDSKNNTFVGGIRSNNEHLFNHCAEEGGSLATSRYKLKKECVYNYLRMWIMTFPGFKDLFEGDIDWSRIEIFLNVYYRFVNNKPRSPKPNSMVDLLNFLYLDDGRQYWSEEKEFLELLRQSYGSTIPPFIYEGGNIVNEIF